MAKPVVSKKTETELPIEKPAEPEKTTVEIPATKRDKTLNLYQRLNLVMRDVDYVQKEAKKVNNLYTFASHDAVTAAVRKPLVEHGVYVQIDVVKHELVGNMTIVDLQGTFINIDDPEDRMPVRAFGYGIDGQDKGPGKAISYAVKTFYLKAFGLETGDDPERDDIPRRPALPIAVPPSATSPSAAPPPLSYLSAAEAPEAAVPQPAAPPAPSPEVERENLLAEVKALAIQFKISPAEIRKHTGGKSSADVDLETLRRLPAQLREYGSATEMAGLYQKLNVIVNELKVSPTDLADFIAKECSGKTLEQLNVDELRKVATLLEMHAEAKKRGA